MGTLIYAHRGASSLAPENTMPAFRLARTYGADGIELDIQLSKDGVPVVIHDATLKRTTNGFGFVKDFTVSELKLLDAGNWFSSKFEQTRIPTLQEVLDWMKDTDMKLNIELKNTKVPYPSLEEKAYELIKAYQMESRTVFSSFNHESLKTMLKIDSSLDVAPLSSKKIDQPWNYALALGTKSIHLKFTLISQKLVKKCHEHGITVRTYTVNRPGTIKKCFRYQVDGIMTDVPQTIPTLTTKR